MDLNRIIGMIVNTVIRQLVGRGVNAAMNSFSSRDAKGARGRTPPPVADAGADEEARRGRDLADRMRQTQKIGRKLW